MILAWFIIDLPYGNLTGHGVDPEAEYIPIINQFGLVARQMDANECLPLTAVLVGDQPGAVQPVADEIQLTAGYSIPFRPSTLSSSPVVRFHTRRLPKLGSAWDSSRSTIQLSLKASRVGTLVLSERFSQTVSSSSSRMIRVAQPSDSCKATE